MSSVGDESPAKRPRAMSSETPDDPFVLVTFRGLSQFIPQKEEPLYKSYRIRFSMRLINTLLHMHKKVESEFEKRDISLRERYIYLIKTGRDLLVTLQDPAYHAKTMNFLTNDADFISETWHYDPSSIHVAFAEFISGLGHPVPDKDTELNKLVQTMYDHGDIQPLPLPTVTFDAVLHVDIDQDNATS